MTVLPGSLDYLYYNGILDHIPYEAYEGVSVPAAMPNQQASGMNVMNQNLNVQTNPYSGLANSIAPKVTTANNMGVSQFNNNRAMYNSNTMYNSNAVYNSNVAYNSNASQYIKSARQGTMYGDYETSADSFYRQGNNGQKQITPRGLGNNNMSYNSYNSSGNSDDMTGFRESIVQEGKDTKQNNLSKGPMIKGILALGAITTGLIVLIKRIKK